MFDRDLCVASLVPIRQPDLSRHDPCVPSDIVETDGVYSLCGVNTAATDRRDGAGNQRISTDLQVAINAMINKLISALLSPFLVHAQQTKKEKPLMTTSVNAAPWDASLFSLLQNPPLPFYPRK